MRGRLRFGAGTAAGSFGQFLFPPFGVALIDNFGWQPALTVFAVLMLLIAAAVARARDAAGDVAECGGRRPTSSRSSTALAEAFGHRSYVLLVLGFFTCGFQLAFITVHLPAYLDDRGVCRRRSAAGWSPPSACSTSSARSASAGCRTDVRSASILVCHLFRPRAVDRGLHLVPDHDLSSAIVFGVATGLPGSRRCRRPRRWWR